MSINNYSSQCSQFMFLPLHVLCLLLAQMQFLISHHLAGKIPMGKWVRAQILYHNGATSSSEGFQLWFMGNWEEFHFVSCSMSQVFGAGQCCLTH